MIPANCLVIIGCALKGQRQTSLSIALEDSVGDNAVDFTALDKVDANHVKRPLEFTGVKTFDRISHLKTSCIIRCIMHSKPKKQVSD